MTHSPRRPRRRWSIATALAVVVSTIAASAAMSAPVAADAAAPRTAKVTDEVRDAVAADGTAAVVVVPRTNATALRRALPEHRRTPAAAGTTSTSMFVPMRVDASQLDELERSDQVRAVVPNTLRRLSLAKSTTTVGAPLAWSEGYTGGSATPSTVAVLDSGVQSNHPFLGGRVVAQACFSGAGGGFTGVTSACPGGELAAEGPGSGEPCPLSECAHGTHVAGIAAGADGPTSAPSGVAPGANIVSIKITSIVTTTSFCGASTPCIAISDYDVYNALEWVRAHRSQLGIVAANMSFGSGSYPGSCDGTESTYASLFGQLRAEGVAPVVASGNDGSESATASPACVSGAVAVGAVATADLKVTDWSNSSSQLDLLAPGATTSSPPSVTGIWSSVPTSAYARMAGTSMAAPHVAGAFAVLHQAYPSDTVDALEARLETTGRPVLDERQGLTTPLIQLDQAIPRPAGTYHPVDPARIMDTRIGLGSPRLGAAASTTLQVAGAGGVPSGDASAVVLNVTYVNPSASGFVTAWPTGTLRPSTSNLNLVPGDARPNLVTVRLGVGGQVSFYNELGSVDLVADVAGWYDTDLATDPGGTGNTGAYFHAATPNRVVDTRSGVGAAKARLGAGQTLDVDATTGAASTGVPADAAAVVVNITGIAPSTGTHLTAYPDPSDVPATSNVNVGPGQTRPNLAIVPLDGTGHFTVRNNLGTVDVVIDVEGWYDATPGDRFRPISPTRILDTRTSLGTTGPVGANTTKSLLVAGVASLPSDVRGVVMNVTSVAPTQGGFVTVYPGNVTPRPEVSNLNLEVGRDVPNLTSVGVGAGRVRLYNAVGSLHLVGDVAGWFAP